MRKRPTDSSKEIDALANARGVYVICGRGFRKIGVTGNIDQRLRDLQRSSGHLLRVEYFEHFAGARKVERQAHIMLRCWRVHGEWFDIGLPTALLAIEGAGSGCPRISDFFAMLFEVEVAKTSYRQRRLRTFASTKYPDLWARAFPNELEPDVEEELMNRQIPEVLQARRQLRDISPVASWPLRFNLRTFERAGPEERKRLKPVIAAQMEGIEV